MHLDVGKRIEFWRHNSGSSLIEHSLFVSLVLAVIFVAVAAAGIWAFDILGDFLGALGLPRE